MGNGALAIGPKLPRPSSTLPKPQSRHSACRSGSAAMSGYQTFQQGPLSGSLWPAHAWRGRLDGQHLTCPPPVGHACGTSPLGRHQMQRSSVGASEHAGEAASIEIDRLQDLAALANAHATLVGDVGVPDGVLCIEADTIGNAVTEVGPHSSVRKATVGLDVEGRELSAVRLRSEEHTSEL